MASPSTDTKIENPALAEPRNEGDQNATTKTPKPISSPSVFVNSEPIRPEQVENAVKFLSHPKVRGSPVMYRRSFLEKKGLTKEEIDEAFKRVPDPSPTVQGATVNQDPQPKLVANAQLQAPAQAQQTSAAPTRGVISRVISQPRFHWTHAIYAVGILAVSGAGSAVLFKNALIPRLKSWIRKIASEDENGVVRKPGSKPSATEEAAAAAKTAAEAAAQVAKASQEMMDMNIEEKRCFRNLIDMLEVQQREMREMSFTIRKLEDQTNSSSVVRTYSQDYRLSSSKQPYTNGMAEFNSLPGRSSLPPASVNSSIPPYPKSYIEEFNDLSSNAYQHMPNSGVAPRSKPWEAGQPPNSSSTYQLQADSDLGNINGSTSRWQQKNVRIAELENEEESKVGPYYSSQAPEQTARRPWVPPQPPPVAMAEAAEAIRRPKPTVQKEQQLTGDHKLDQPLNELQSVTDISEMGGAPEARPSEIVEELEGNC
ncbi:hypothetical protein SAY87_010672 [Trapa incisa]|uniref:Peroxisomal membrane protein PEX14 n=1 Tax=Trapa incisa TaxID=236973 RepID=A0AAN7GJW6_9MYRT|nr:hypothetical protein SAY87_010672 [Trapa incisa]